MTQEIPRPKRKITRVQARVLENLRWVDRATPKQLGTNAGPLRLLQEQGLVQCNLHGQWSLTREGRAKVEELDNVRQ